MSITQSMMMDESDEDVMITESSRPKLPRKTGEKLRRERFNNLIAKLAEELLPVKYAHGRLDKITILRLSVCFMKLHYGLKRKQLIGAGCQQEHDILSWYRMLSDYSLLIVMQMGTILYVSSKTTGILGYHQTDMLGYNIDKFIHPDDMHIFKAQFNSPTNGAYSSASRTCSNKSGTFASENLYTFCTENNCFYVKMLKARKKNQVANDESKDYELMCVRSHCENLGESNTKRSVDESWMVATIQPVSVEKIKEVSIQMSEFLKNNEWASMHDLDSRILAMDQRSSLFSGYLVSEVLGKTPYVLIVDEDLEYIARSHGIIMKDQETPSTVFRMKSSFGIILYVQAHSVIINDQWTKKPKCIVSVNTLLEDAQGRHLLEVQRKKVQDHFKSINVELRNSDISGDHSKSFLSGSHLVTDNLSSNDSSSSMSSNLSFEIHKKTGRSLSEIYSEQAQKYTHLLNLDHKSEPLSKPLQEKRLFDRMVNNINEDNEMVDSEEDDHIKICISKDSSDWLSVKRPFTCHTTSKETVCGKTNSDSFTRIDQESNRFGVQETPKKFHFLPLDNKKKLTNTCAKLPCSKMASKNTAMPLLKGILEGHLTLGTNHHTVVPTKKLDIQQFPDNASSVSEHITSQYSRTCSHQCCSNGYMMEPDIDSYYQGGMMEPDIDACQDIYSQCDRQADGGCADSSSLQSPTIDSSKSPTLDP